MEQIHDILDIIIYIASFDEDTWFRLTIIHDRFKDYAFSNIGRLTFINNFTKITKEYPISYTLFRKLNSINDKPSLIYENGAQLWYKNGLKHRENNLPATIDEYGSQFWYKNGLRHRKDDLPAVIYENGTKYWFINGLEHRDGDLPAVIHSTGICEWWKNGILLRQE